MKYKRKIHLIININEQDNIEANDLKQVVDIILQETCSFHEKYRRGKGIIYESIQVNHLIQCKQSQFDCFCHKYQQVIYINQQIIIQNYIHISKAIHYFNYSLLIVKNLQQLKQFIHITIKESKIQLKFSIFLQFNVFQSKLYFKLKEVYIKQQADQDCEDRSNFLIEYIYSIIRQVSLNKTTQQKNTIMFYYIYYALQILKNPIKCLQTYYRLTKLIENKKSTSIFDFMISYEIKQKISQTFNEQFFKQSSSNYFLEIYDVIIYEKKKQSFDQKMFDCINDTINYYDYLQSNVLSYSKIELSSLQLLKQKKELQEDFQFLSKFAEHNESIVFMGQIFLEAFDQQSQTILSFFQEYIRKDRFSNSQFHQFQSINPSDGVVYCSLLDKGYRISQHSSSFVQLLNLSHQNIVNYDVTSFLPTEKHIMENLIYSLRHSNKKLPILNERDRFGFGINERSQIIFLNISTKIEYLKDEVGICILAKQVSTFNNYLLLSKHNQILGVTRQIYDLIEDHYNFKKIVGTSVEDHIPCLTYFDYEAGKDFLQNTIFVIDKKHKKTDLTPLLNNKNVKQKFEQYLVFDVSFKLISVKLDSQTVQFNYLDILEFKLVQREHEISTKINQLKNLIENPQLMQMDKTKFISKLVDSRVLVDSKFNNETKYFGETKSFGDGRIDSFDGNTNYDRYQSESKQLQSMADKKISFNVETQILQSSPQQLTQKTSIFQRTESQNQQSPRYLSTNGQNLIETNNEELQLQSPRLTENQLNDINILSTRDFRSARLILEPTQYDDQNKFTDQKLEDEGSQNKKSDESSQSMTNFENEQIQKVVSNKGSSLNSKSSNYKSRIPKKIRQKRMSCNLQYFTMIGLLSLLLLIIVNWVVYQISHDGIIRYQSQFKTISNPMAMYMKSLDLLRSISYFYLMLQNDISVQDEQRKQETHITKIDQNNILQAFKNDFFDLIETGNNKQLLQYLTSITMDVSDMVDIRVDENADFFKRFSNLLLTLKDYLTSAYNFIYFRDDNRELTMWENMILFKQKIFTFQEYMKEDMVNVLEQCQVNNFIALVIVICSSFSLMIVVLVVIYVQQMQKRKILSLLGCFTPDILANKVDRLEELIFQYKQRYIFNNHRRKSLMFDAQSNKNTLKTKSRNYMDYKKDFINKMKKNHVFVINLKHVKNVNDNNENYFSNQTENDSPIKLNSPIQLDSPIKLNSTSLQKDEENTNYFTENQNKDQNENKINKQNVSILRSSLRKQSQFQDKQLDSNKKITNAMKKENYQKRKRDTATKSFSISQKKLSEVEISNSNKRKRIQASFDKYRALKIIHFILGLLILCIINCQSVVNIILFEPYLEEQKWLIDEKLKIYDIGAVVIQNAAPQVLNLEWLWRGGDSLDSVYFRFMNSVKDENVEKLLLVKTLANPLPFTMDDDEEYQKFYLPMLSGDICKTRELYKQYVNSNFTFEFCNYIYESILTKGFLFTLSKTYQELESIKELYIHYDEIIYPDTIYEVEDYYAIYKINGHNLTDINNILKFVNESIVSICQYFHNTSQKFTDKILGYFFTIFIIQNIIVLFTVISIWVVINKQLKNEIQQAKLYFTLFNVRLLQTNSPINQYFTEFSK